MMVADMTTFMARLVSKLTQAATNHANNLVKKIDEANRREQIFQKIEPIKISADEFIEFTTNTQLLEDDQLSIPTCVAKIQNLAKKHVECLQMLHSFSINQMDNT